MDTITFLIIIALILCVMSLIHGYRTGEFRDKTLKEYLYKNIKDAILFSIFLVIVWLGKYKGIKLLLYVLGYSAGFFGIDCIIDTLIYYTYKAISKINNN